MSTKNDNIIEMKETAKKINPWAFRLGPIYIAKKRAIGSNSPLIAATGYRRLSKRIFLRHFIGVNDVVQIREGFDDKFIGCYAQIEKVHLESVDLVVPAPANPKAVILKAKRVPVGCLLKVGKGPTRTHGTRRRSTKRLLKNKN